MTPLDQETALALLLNEDLRHELRTADTLPAPPLRSELSGVYGVYVECPWLYAGQVITISGRVDRGEVRCFAAEDETGKPVRVSGAYMADAIEDLVAATREL